MKNLTASILAFLISASFVQAQKASDVLENGIPVKWGKKIVLQFDSTTLKYDAVRSIQDITRSPDFTTLEDSTIFLVSKNEVNVYMTPPLNPLNYLINTENKITVDPVNDAAANALNAITVILSQPGSVLPAAGSPNTSIPIPNRLDTIEKLLAKDQKAGIAAVFNRMKEMTFVNEDSTLIVLKASERSIKKIERHFEQLDSLIKDVRSNFSTIQSTLDIGLRYTYSNIIKDFSEMAAEQEKRLANLKKAYALVKAAQVKASKGGGVGMKWCTPLPAIPSKAGKISNYSISIQKSGYELSAKNEIVSVDPKAVLNKNIRVRKFQRFVPENSVGVAYTSFTYNTYGTTTDGTGQQHVAPPTINAVHNLNLTTMLNFNYYIQNSPIHPLYQIGAGINAGIPSLLTGFGIRTNVNGANRIAITGGVAMTWLKELDKLKVGDVIKGTDDINKDLKYQFTWPPKPYIGIQVNF